MPKKNVGKPNLTESQRERLLNALSELKRLEMEVIDRSSPHAIKVRDGIYSLMEDFGLSNLPTEQ